MVELCEAWVDELLWQRRSPVALGGSRADGCSLLGPFESGATPAGGASPGTSPRALLAWAGGHHDPLYAETLPAVSDSNC